MEAFMHQDKVYVPVVTKMWEDGRMLPLFFVCGGHRYKIESVLSIRVVEKEECVTATDSGEDPEERRLRKANICEFGRCDEFTVKVQGRLTRLYLERWGQVCGEYYGRWFVMRKPAP